ncbi:MAG: BsuBI/PstI family type II restriction endonuclease [Dehalococcoidia bacterium]
MYKVPDYFDNPKNSNFLIKDVGSRKVISEALYILDRLGIPLADKTARAKEKIAMAFLAVIDVKSSANWSKAKDAKDKRSLKSRDIINYINSNFHEAISSGSYDDIRRKDLLLPVMAEIIIHTKPDSARNDPARGYALNPAVSSVIRAFGTTEFNFLLKQFIDKHGQLRDKLEPMREIQIIPIRLNADKELRFSPGEHNQLIKEIIEKFLPRFGFGAEVLYVGDAAHKLLHIEETKLKQLNFFELAHGELPDVVAYSQSKNWLFLIEAVYTSNPISVSRHLQLKQLTSNCTADIIFVSAFLNKGTFRRFAGEISWETEVWISENPDHLIHYDGEKFLGPYKPVC